MNIQATERISDLKPESVDSLRDLAGALQDSVNYHEEAADKVSDKRVANLFKTLSSERKEMSDQLNGMLASSTGKPAEGGTMSGKLREIWTSMRGALNAGDAKVILTEAERAEDVIVHKFEKVMPELAGNPVHKLLMDDFRKIKSGHDQVLKLRNQYQQS